MQRVVMLILGLFSLILAGCMSPAAPAPPAPTAPVTLHLTTGLRVQALVNAWTSADINHVRLTVYRGGTLVAGAGRTVTQAQLASPLTLRNLRINTSYEVRAEAYRDAGATQLISDSTTSRATFTTPALATSGGVATISTAPLAVSLPVRLVNKTYVGKGTYTISVQSNFNGKNTLTHVRVRLVRVDPTTGAETALGSRTFTIAEVLLGQSYAISNMRFNTTYRLYGDGLASDGTVASTDSKSNVTFTTPALASGSVEDTVALQTVPVIK